MIKRKTTKSQRGKVVLDRVHLPEEHYQPGTYVDVTVDGPVVTIKPVPVVETCAHAYKEWMGSHPWICLDCGNRLIPESDGHETSGAAR